MPSYPDSAGAGGRHQETSPGKPGGRWREAFPCPVCGHNGWCKVSTDGAVALCRRTDRGCDRARQDRNGVPYWLHRLDGSTAPTPGPRPDQVTPRLADPDTLHRVYSALLAALVLGKAHRDNLCARGLSPDQIERRGYRSLPRPRERPGLTRDLRERFGEALLSVPGFAVRQREGRSYVTLAGAAGLLVPVRDLAGRVVALLSRPDKADGRGKYLWLSSTKDGGPSSGAPAHVPLGVGPEAETVRLTEGALKADVATALSGLPTIGAAGMAWRPCLEVLRGLGCKTVLLAFDADAASNATVAGTLAVCAKGLADAGLAVQLERWPLRQGKGIDDALAAGHRPEVLAGDNALAAIREIQAAAGSGLGPGALARLREAIGAGGAEAVYRDRPLLQSLARLAEEDPGEWACVRLAAKSAGMSVRDLDRVVAPFRPAYRLRRPPPDAAGCYRIAGGKIVSDDFPLAEWSARIVEQTARDDGRGRSVTLTVEGALAGGEPLPRLELTADEFARMDWPLRHWGARAVVHPGPRTRDSLRCAIQLLSGDIPTRTLYTHTGWREIEGAWCYLHAGGAIGPSGQVAEVATELPEALASFRLPAPPEGRQLVEAVRASLRLRDLGPRRILDPLLAAVYRAPLGETNFTLWVAGPSGSYKTELAALLQRHFGRGMDAEHLPTSWGSTGNSIEALGALAKDCLLVVDDFAPGASAVQQQRLHQEAERVVRAQGNRSGRQRLSRDSALRQGAASRCLWLSTGEDVPGGQSFRARLLVLEVSHGDLGPRSPAVNPKLSACQQDAAGLYARAMAGYLRWLARQYGDLRGRLRAEAAELRRQALEAGVRGHARTAGIVAELALGLRYLFAYAVDAGALTPAEAGCYTSCYTGSRLEPARKAPGTGAMWEECWASLLEAAAEHAGQVHDADPAEQFVRLVAAALSSGRAHLTNRDGLQPDDPGAWGWQGRESWSKDLEGKPTTIEYVAQGRRVGCVEGEDLYLQPQAAYAEAQELARQQGERLQVTARTLWKRLREGGWLASYDDTRERNTVRRTIDGKKDTEVIHLRAGTLTAQKPSIDGKKDTEVIHLRAGTLTAQKPSAPSAAGAAGGANPNRDSGSAGGRFEETTLQNRPQPQKPSAAQGGDGAAGGRCGRFSAGESEKPSAAQGDGGQEDGTAGGRPADGADGFWRTKRGEPGGIIHPEARPAGPGQGEPQEPRCREPGEDDPE
jgi:hypothetical protein